MTTLRFLIILLLALNALAFAAVRGWLGNAPPTGEPGRIASQLHPERIRLAREDAPRPQVTADAVGQGLSATLRAPEPAAMPLPPTVGSVPGTAVTDASDPAPGEDASAMAAAESPAPATAPEPAEIPAQPAADALGAPAVSTTTDASQDGSGEPAAEVAAPGAAADASTPTVCHAWASLTADQADRLSQRLRRIGATPIRARTETPDSWWVRIAPQRTRADAERRVVELNLLGVTDTFIVQDPGPTQYAVSLGVFKTENRARVLLGQLRERGVSSAGIEPRMSTTYRIQADLPARELRAVESAAPGLRARRQTCGPR